MKAAPIAVMALLFLASLAFIPLPKAHAVTCPFNGAAIDGLVEGHQSTTTGSALTLTLSTQCTNEAIEVFVNCVAESSTVPCGSVSDAAGLNWGAYGANNAWVVGYRFDGPASCADTSGCGYLLNGHAYAISSGVLTSDVITISAGTHASAVVGAVAFGVYDSNNTVTGSTNPGPYDPGCKNLGGCDNNIAYDTSPLSMDWAGGTQLHPDLIIAWPAANQTGFMGTASGFSAVNFASGGSGIYQWTNSFQYQFVSTTWHTTVTSTLPGGATKSVGIWGTWAVPLLGPPDTNVVVIQVVPCTFFELQCWWYPAVMFGTIGGLFFAFGAAAEVSSKALIYLLLAGLTFASLLEVQMGMISIMFPLLFSAGAVLFALRYDSGQDEGGGNA